MRLGRAKIRYRRRYLLIAILMMILLPPLIVWLNTFNKPGQGRESVASLPSPLCRRGDPLAGVYNPLRFRILSNCEVGRGVVDSTDSQKDGGLWIKVAVDGNYSKLLGQGNISHENGLLILELGSGDRDLVPSIGERIVFVGPLVYDVLNGFNAIYPVWSITPS